jgi:hypothetical protein
MNIRVLLMFSFFQLLWQSAAAIESCGLLSIKDLTIEASRENGSAWANTMSFNVSKGSCDGLQIAYLKNDHPAYASILSALLSLKVSGELVEVYVKSSSGLSGNAREIEYIRIP